MASTISSAFSEFFSVFAGIVMSLFHSLLGVFQAMFALGKDTIVSVLQLGQSIVKLGMDLFQGFFGFVTANFLALALIGGGYYLYTQKYQGKGRKTVVRK
ncbi:uncharacterized protein EV420DRAFT_952387 [Desarmillaria tabescens]|uniref:DUF2523 domain-containing protein n=1 Tax=Armillaria tabescens TaxID=1929756 RepID=A0AA39NGQ8_ARMTA|nr:uncharacterized protein EV420DRAFT_952387 [Desarmillaria tabescens]KAK0465320.1 hypothetical protein EV420DRAFT_952387 [Desarmillaria tabescens]